MITEADREAAKMIANAWNCGDRHLAHNLTARHRTASTAALTAEIQRLREALRKAHWVVASTYGPLTNQQHDALAAEIAAALSTPSEVSEPSKDETFKRSAREQCVAYFANRTRTTALTEALRYFAERPTNDEMMKREDPPEWAGVSVERRVEILGERKRAYDAAILKARAVLSEVSEPVADESGGEGEVRRIARVIADAYDADEFERTAWDGVAKAAIRAVRSTPPNPTNGDAVREALEEISWAAQVNAQLGEADAREAWSEIAKRIEEVLGILASTGSGKADRTAPVRLFRREEDGL